ncbi:hypothetical protein EDB83DRAFT_2675420 [Lactarius deliciosus]|nr:hypothetical protein EDB83DRAFT_2675420 [Lactarius deliciosus]
MRFFAAVHAPYSRSGVLLCWVQDVPGGPTSAHDFAFDRHVEVGTMVSISKYVDGLRINVDDLANAPDLAPEEMLARRTIGHRAPVGSYFSNAVLQTLTVLMAERPPKVRRLVIATTSLYPILTDFGITPFDAQSRVAPITDLTVFDRVLEAVELSHTRDRGHAASIGTEDA